MPHEIIAFPLIDGIVLTKELLKVFLLKELPALFSSDEKMQKQLSSSLSHFYSRIDKSEIQSGYTFRIVKLPYLSPDHLLIDIRRVKITTLNDYRFYYVVRLGVDFKHRIDLERYFYAKGYPPAVFGMVVQSCIPLYILSEISRFEVNLESLLSRLLASLLASSEISIREIKNITSNATTQIAHENRSNVLQHFFGLDFNYQCDEIGSGELLLWPNLFIDETDISKGLIRGTLSRTAVYLDCKTNLQVIPAVTIFLLGSAGHFKSPLKEKSSVPLSYSGQKCMINLADRIVFYLRYHS